MIPGLILVEGQTEEQFVKEVLSPYAGGNLDPLRTVRAAVATPEEINENYATAPSRRIKNAVPAYQKTLHGPMAALEIGIDTIRAQCPHFNAWLTKLEAVR